MYILKVKVDLFLLFIYLDRKHFYCKRKLQLFGTDLYICGEKIVDRQ